MENNKIVIVTKHNILLYLTRIVCQHDLSSGVKISYAAELKCHNQFIFRKVDNQLQITERNFKYPRKEKLLFLFGPRGFQSNFAFVDESKTSKSTWRL